MRPETDIEDPAPMTTRTRLGDDRSAHTDRLAPTTDASIEDHLLMVKRQLLGVPRHQLLDEQRKQAQRTAVIEARTHRR